VIADLPFTGQKSDHLVQLDDTTTTWQLGAFFSLSHDWATAESHADNNGVVAVQATLGRSSFDYYPDGASKVAAERTSYAVSLRLRFEHVPIDRSGGTWQLAPQLRVDLVRSWKAPDPVAVVPTDGGPLPPTFPVDIVAPPTRTTKLVVRAAYLTERLGSPWAAGASVVYVFTGDKDSRSPFDGYDRVRAEAWLYYYPGDGKNTRFGFAPFVDVEARAAVAGLDKLASVEVGALAQLKVATTMLEY